MDLLYAIAAALDGFMNSPPGLVGMVLGFVLATIPVVVLHELGHAVVARRLLDADVDRGGAVSRTDGRLALDAAKAMRAMA